jgi:hypothetical protein
MCTICPHNTKQPEPRSQRHSTLNDDNELKKQIAHIIAVAAKNGTNPDLLGELLAPDVMALIHQRDEARDRVEFAAGHKQGALGVLTSLKSDGYKMTDDRARFYEGWYWDIVNPGKPHKYDI